MHLIESIVIGMIIGFGAAVFIGPVGVLCIDRTLKYGKRAGLVSGLGAALADGIYGILAVCSVTFVTGFLIPYQNTIRGLGSLILIGFGIKIFLEKISKKKGDVSKKDILEDFISTFFLTFTNPITIVTFISLLAVFGLKDVSKNPAEASAIILGIFTGSILWWILVCEITCRFRPKNLQKVNKIAGILIAGFGAIMALSVISEIVKTMI